MKKRRNKVIIITILLLILAAIILLSFRSSTVQTHEFDTTQQSLANQVITLPDGHHVLASFDKNPHDQGWIGATLTELTSTIRHNLQFAEEYGVYVQDTYLDSPAQVAGLLPGDILIKINDNDAQDVLPALTLIAKLAPGNTYPFTVFRQGKYLSYPVTVIKKENFF